MGLRLVAKTFLHLYLKGGDWRLAITKERKEELVAQYADLLDRSRAIIFTEYRGLSNVELTKLRRAIREAGGVYHVTKLSLLKRAMEDAGYPFPDYLDGAPFALGFCFDEVPSVAKALTEYAEDVEEFVIRGGLMEGQPLTFAQIEKLSDMPPLEVLRAQLLGLLDAPAANLVGVVQAAVGQVVNVLNAYVDKGEEYAPSAAQAAVEPVAEAPAVEEAEAEPVPESVEEPAVEEPVDEVIEEPVDEPGDAADEAADAEAE
jgi:large subunit ribosomal protein L10